MNILIADDEPRYRDLMAIFFEKWPDHAISMAENGKDAWDQLNDPAKRFDVAFLDISMPVLSGLDVLKLMSLSDRYRWIDTVMCTARNDRATIVKALELGARHYLIKPWTLETIEAKLKQISEARNTAK